MERLFLMRHGIAVARGTPEIADDDRPLLPKGTKRTRVIADGLRALDLGIRLIVSSPLPRALATAEIVADALGPETVLEIDEVLRPSTDASTLLDWIHTRSETRILAVGHDPALSELVALLATGEHSRGSMPLKKGGVAAFRRRAGGGFTLDWLARPKLFRNLLGRP